MKNVFITTLFFLICAQMITAKSKNLNLVFIGNSITAGALIDVPEQNAPPARVVSKLSQQSVYDNVAFVNCGVSGCTTVDYLPAMNTLFPKMLTAVASMDAKDADMVFSIMLGTNDSAIKGPTGSPVLPQQYRTNLKVIIEALLHRFPKAIIVLNRPLWYSPNTYNGAMYLEEGLSRLNKYWAELQTLQQEFASEGIGNVYLGDDEAYSYFKDNYLSDLIAEQGNAGTFYLHPNAKGADVLATFWLNAINRVLTSKK